MKARFRLLQGRSVLIVDDSPQVVSLLEDVLGACGAVTHTAAGAVEAWRLLEAGHFDLLIADMHVRGPRGGMLEQLRSRRADLLRRTLLLSGRRWDAAERRRAESLGASVCPKPFDIDDLRRRACDLLAGRSISSVA